MNDIKIFKNEEFGTVRTIEIDNEPWFVGKDVAKALGYKNTKDALISHVDDEDKRILQRSEVATIENHIPKSSFPVNFLKFDIPNRGLTIINESGLYSLILCSKLPDAKKFKYWVTNEVLPSIRKHGAYMTESTLEKVIQSPDFGIRLLTALKQEQDNRKQLEQKIEEYKPLVQFANQVAESNGSIEIGTFAKIISNKYLHIGRNRLFDWFRLRGYLMSNNEPMQIYIDKGYFEMSERTYDNSPNIYRQTLVTGKGQIYFTDKIISEFSGGIK